MPRSRRALLAAIGSSAALAGCLGSDGGTTTTRPTTSDGATTTTTSTTTTTTAAGGEVRWTLETGAEPAGIVVRANRIHYGSDAVYALEADGEERWRYTADSAVRSFVVDDRVYATTGVLDSPAGSGFALRAIADGSEQWSFARDGVGMLSEPAVGPDGVYVATRDDYLQDEGETLYGLSTGGERQWTADVGDAETAVAGDTVFASYPRTFEAFDPDGTRRWTTSADAISPTLLGVRDGTAFAFWGSTLRALALSDGSERWSSSDAGPTTLVESGLYTVTDDGVAQALDPASGESTWEQPVPDIGSIAVVDDTVYVLGETVSALDAADGSVRWRREFEREPLSTAVGARVFLAWSMDTLYALDAADGTERWTFTPDVETEHPHPRALAVGDQNGYVAFGDGTLYALAV